VLSEPSLEAKHLDIFLVRLNHRPQKIAVEGVNPDFGKALVILRDLWFRFSGKLDAPQKGNKSSCLIQGGIYFREPLAELAYCLASAICLGDLPQPNSRKTDLDSLRQEGLSLSAFKAEKYPTSCASNES